MAPGQPVIIYSTVSQSRWIDKSLKRGRLVEKLPVTLLKAAANLPMLVELKSGETYNGHLVACDDWMNVHLKEVICTSRDGDRFWKMPECYIRGSIIKYLRIPDEVVEKVKEDIQLSRARSRAHSSDGRGGNRGKGRGRGGPAGGAARGGSTGGAARGGPTGGAARGASVNRGAPGNARAGLGAPSRGSFGGFRGKS